MYVPVKGGAEAIAASRIAMDRARIEDEAHPGIMLDQIIAQMSLALDRIMTEGGLYDRRLAALAFKQAQGDVAEAVFLLRAHRAQLPDFGVAEPVDLSGLRDRHISATHKELPGGQVLGETFDYTHRLLDFSLEGPRARPALPTAGPVLPGEPQPKVASCAEPPVDITRTPPSLTPTAAERLGHLARGEEGYLTGLAYESLRKAGAAHPYIAELSAGRAEVMVTLEDLGLSVQIGEIELTACTAVLPDTGPEPKLREGFGIAFGRAERKAVAMAVVDLQARAGKTPADLLMHADGVAASGYVSHLKLPHYSDFDADMARLRRAQEQL